MLFQNLNNFKKNIAIFNNKKKIYYNDLVKDVKELEKKLEDKNRNLCFLVAENSPTFIKLYISLVRLNYVIILIDVKINSDNLENLINDYKPNLIFIPKNYILRFKKKILFKYSNYLIFKHEKSLHKLNKELLIMLPTSGTTGSSKMVMLSKANIYKNSKDIIKYLNLKKNHIALANLPFHYSYGLSILNTHLMCGAKLFLQKNSIISKEFKNLFSKNKINCFYGVPETYEIFKRLDLKIQRSFQFFAIAGGKISKNSLKFLIEIADKLKINIFNMYGQTEASPRISFSNYTNKRDLDKIYTVGRCFGGGKIFIKKNNRILKKNSVGNIYYYGKNVMIGYAKSFKDLNNKRINKFLIETGDLGFLDENNNLNLSGRNDRYIKLDSERVNLNDIEDMLNTKFYNNKYLIIFLKNKINIISDKKSSLNLEEDYLISKLKIKRNYVNSLSDFKFEYLSNGKLNYKNIEKKLIKNFTR